MGTLYPVVTAVTCNAWRLARAGGGLMVRAMDDPTDIPLDALRQQLAPLIPANAAFDGWGEQAAEAAGAQLGLPPGRAALAFPGGAVAMIDAWFAHVDRTMAADLAPSLPAMKVRDRITALIARRLELLDGDREALRRALAILAMPQNLATAARLGWRAADVMWRAAGDTAPDFAHYTKRATLAAVYGATLLAFLDDESEDLAETRAFLDRRIAGVMRFETFKARLKPDGDAHFNVARFLGRLRYPVV